MFKIRLNLMILLLFIFSCVHPQYMIQEEDEKKSGPGKEIVIFDDKLIDKGNIYWYPGPPAGESKIEIVEGDAHSGKKAIKAEFDPKKWSGLEIVWATPMDFSKLRETGALELWLKGSMGSPDFDVGLVNSKDSGKPIYTRMAVDKFIKINNEEWQKVVIPLNQLPKLGSYWDEEKQTTIPGEFNWKDVTEVTITSGPSWGGDNKFMVDDIRIITSYTPGKDEISKKIDELKEMFSHVKTKINSAKDKGLNIDINKAEKSYKKSITLLDSSRAKLKKKDHDTAFNLLKESENNLYNAYCNTFESRKVESRGLWIQYWKLATKDEIKRFVKQIADANFNFVGVETYLDGGHTIYPTKAGEQFAAYKGWDPLKALVDECRKYGLEVHAWCQIFSVTGSGGGGPLVKKHPEWLSWETPLKKAEPGVHYWVCPARDEHKEFFKKFVKEIVKNYKIGIHYDYVRYPQSPKHSCYFCRKKFMDEYKIDPWGEKIQQNVDQWMQWNIYRENLISEFVKDVTAYIKDIDPNVPVSAAVFPVPDNQHGFLNNQLIQDWENWVANQYIDFVCPMEYSSDVEHVKKKIKMQEDVVKGRTCLYHGLGRFMMPNTFELLKQLETARDTDGTCMFSLNSLSDADFEVLKNGPYREKAILPHAKGSAPVLAALGGIKEKIKITGISDTGLNDLINKAEDLARKAGKKDFKKGVKETEDLNNTVKEMETLVKSKKEKTAGILSDIKYLKKLIKIKMYNRKIIQAAKAEPAGKLKLVDIPEANLTKAAKPPVIDGEITDSAWQKSAETSDFWYYNGSSKLPKNYKTTAYLTYDDKNLYIGVNCKKGDERYTLNAKPGGNVWEDDSIELFIDIEGKGIDYFQLIMNAAEVKFSNKGNLNWKCKTVKKKKGWTLETAIPFSLLNKTPVKGETWRINICRNDYTLTTPHIGWSCTYGSFHTPSRFGKIIFK